jgi:hypothetical protein
VVGGLTPVVTCGLETVLIRIVYSNGLASAGEVDTTVDGPDLMMMRGAINQHLGEVSAPSPRD